MYLDGFVRPGVWTLLAAVCAALDFLAAPARGQQQAPSPAAAAPLFEADVLPLLKTKCLRCHGEKGKKAELDLRSRAGVLKGSESGPVVVPGKPLDSPLYEAVHSGKMPPGKNPKLSSSEVEILRRWIEGGARFAAAGADSSRPPLTQHDALPILLRRCTVCHGPRVQEAGLDLRSRAAMLRGGKSGPAIVPGKPDESRLIRKIHAGEMPPRRRLIEVSIKPVEPAETEVLARWIALGAPEVPSEPDVAGTGPDPLVADKDRAFWAFQPPRAASPPAVKQSERVRNAIDAFVLQNAEVTPELYDNLVATGFLRMAPDPTWANPTGFLPDRLDVIADEIDVFGSVVLGLTLKCARCHSHKFDPIPQRDYYRLLDVFKGAFDEHDWMKPNWLPGQSKGPRTDRDLPFVPAAERKQWETHNAALQKEVGALRAAQGKKPPPDTEAKIKALEARRLPPPSIRALWDRGEPSPTYLLRRGDYLSPSRLVGPGVPSVLTDGKTPFEVKPPWPGARKTGRRLALARWLTRPNHPLTARVLVNRLWKLHFETGIVKTLDNFGKAGARPTHPELLDWLAVEFVRRGWSIKAMHRLMLTSATYRQSSAVTPAHEKLDPDNALLSRMPLTRMDAESLYDAMLQIAGRLDERRFGPPDALQVRPDGLVTPAGTDRGWRRMIYVQLRRKVVATHLENFDFPQMNPNCVQRRDSTVAPQALHLMNNGMVQTLAEHFARRVRQEAGDEPSLQVEWISLAALGRPPTAEEKQVGLAALARLGEQWARHSAGKEGAALAALTTYCHTILNSAAFLYVD
jgi:hypothetical protein